MKNINNLLTIIEQRYFSRFHAYQFDKNSNRNATQILRKIETRESRRLQPALKKRADEYAIKVLGGVKFAPWIYVYTINNGDFREGWIPDNYFSRYVKPDPSLTSISRLKTFANVLFGTNLLPDIAYCLNGVFYDREFSIINFTRLKNLLTSENSEIIIKSDHSQSGSGVVRMLSTDLNPDTLVKMGNCVIQGFVTQSKFFSEICPTSTSTLRITTVRNPVGEIEFRASFLRLGMNDTRWVQSRKSVKVAIVDKCGKLDAVGYTYDWERLTKHPDTGFVFKDKQIPRFREIVDACKSMHAHIPHFPIIGWDTIIDDEEEIHLLEWNAFWPGIKFSEATTGPCFTGLNWENIRKSDSKER